MKLYSLFAIAVFLCFSGIARAASPPSDLVGQFAQTDHGRLEFSTASDGRVFSPGSSDFFTYIYTVTGADDADITLTFTDGIREDIYSVTFVDATSGTYLLDRFENGGAVEEDVSGNFSLGRNRNVTDLKIGDKVDKLVGNDIYNGSGSRQTFRDRERPNGTFDLVAELENDGDADTIRVRGTKGRRQFGVKYFALSPRRNITAAITKGRHSEDLAHGEFALYQINVEPKKDRGSIVLHLTARSRAVPGANDHVKARIKLKRTKRNKGR